MKRHIFIILPFLFLFGCAAAFGQCIGVTLNCSPSKEVGQPKLVAETANPNLVEGRELYSPIGVTLDTSTTPPAVYVSDYGNNRIMAWKNATGFTNGQPADLIIGQSDQYSTSASGSGPASGLSSPTGLAVDKNGNLYVADSGNNRVLRYPKPFSQGGQFPVPDLVLGQPNFSSRTANYTNAVSANGLSLSTSSAPYTVGIAIDSSGNVWVVDAGNRRVLEFMAGDVANGGQGIAAKTVIGEPDFATAPTGLSVSVQSAVALNQLAIPSAIAFDAAGRLYVTDSDSQPVNNTRINRVLVYVPGAGGVFTNGQPAVRMLGGGCLALALYNNQTCPALGSKITSGGEAGNNNFPLDMLLNDPEGIFFLPADSNGNQSIGVVDANYNRIVIFPAYGLWPDQGTLFSPEATAVIGQTGLTGANNVNPNQNTIGTVATPPAGAGTFWHPLGAAYLSSTNELFVSDASNNRVIVMPQSPSATSGFGVATRVLGQDRLTTNAVNLIEGREFYFGTLGDAGVALDTAGSVPHLYVADTYNHRVMAFWDARKMTPGQKADYIIGQADGTTALCNFLGGALSQGGDTNQKTNASMCSPRDVLVDGSGNLYVADTGNGRVLRFPAPFSQCPNGPGSSGCSLPPMPTADLVLGQANFSVTITDPSSTSMNAPYGLAFSGTNGLFVSDLGDNRVLYIPFNDTTNHTFKPFSNGLAATRVFGQPDFVTITAGNAISQLNGPRHVSSDSSGQLYVADTGNNRVLIFPDPNNPQTPTSGAAANLPLTCAALSNGSCTSSLNGPRSVYVNQSTGEIWVANSAGSTAVKFPQYTTLIINPAPTGSVSTYGPLAMAQDQYGDLFIADSANRISVYYQGATWQNGASFLATAPLSPGAFTTLYPVATPTQFGANTATFSGTLPVPTTLGGIQVLVGGTPAPLTYVGPGQINMIVPSNAPQSGTTDVIIVQVSTGQILGAGTLGMNSVAPGIFMGPQLAVGSQGYQAAAVNEDGTVNGPNNPAQRGHIISLYLTGQGLVPNQPPDGQAPNGLAPTPQTPQVFLGCGFVGTCQSEPGDPPAGQWIQFSGMVYPGLWQINVYVPMAAAPSTPTSPALVNVVYNNAAAWSASTTNLKTYVFVK